MQEKKWKELHSGYGLLKWLGIAGGFLVCLEEGLVAAIFGAVVAWGLLTAVIDGFFLKKWGLKPKKD